MSSSRIVHEEEGFRYAIATETSANDIVRVLSESFAREPMAAMLGVSARDLAPLAERFMPECTANELSVVATPADDPGTVAGAFICRDYKAPLPGDILGISRGSRRLRKSSEPSTPRTKRSVLASRSVTRSICGWSASTGGSQNAASRARSSALLRTSPAPRASSAS
jgi:hypothetical protein